MWDAGRCFGVACLYLLISTGDGYPGWVFWWALGGIAIELFCGAGHVIKACS